MAYSIIHLCRSWHIIPIKGSWFVRDDLDSDTGPYSTPEQAEEWVRSIRPA